ncbi:hypothetical protein ACOMHN_033076 [Nucella lapillus]
MPKRKSSSLSRCPTKPGKSEDRGQRRIMSTVPGDCKQIVRDTSPRESRKHHKKHIGDCKQIVRGTSPRESRKHHKRHIGDCKQIARGTSPRESRKHQNRLIGDCKQITSPRESRHRVDVRPTGIENRHEGLL